jgi:hypothetical protein
MQNTETRVKTEAGSGRFHQIASGTNTIFNFKMAAPR